MNHIEDEIDSDMKKKYICENITKITNHKNYLDIVEFHVCPHTKNSNGIFINLNTISSDELNTDIHASSEYRANLIDVLTKKAVKKY